MKPLNLVSHNPVVCSRSNLENNIVYNHKHKKRSNHTDHNELNIRQIKHDKQSAKQEMLLQDDTLQG